MADQNLQDVYTLQIRRHLTTAPPSPFCEACKNGFLHVNSLQVRQFTQTGKLPGVCRACNAAFMRICRMQIRHLTTNEHQPHVCDICQKTFTHAGNYKKHKFMHEKGSLKADQKNAAPTPPFDCKQCGRTFLKYGSYKKHIEKHDSEKRKAGKREEEKNQFECAECSEVFNTKLGLKRHVHDHVCQVCKGVYKTEEALKKHELTCKSEKRYDTVLSTKMVAINEVLKICDREEEMEVQEKDGSPKKPIFECKYCSKIFKRLGSLRKHTLIHEDDGRKYTCATCFHTFNRDMLKIHVPHCTQLSTPHVCKMCKKRFPLVEELEKHMLEHVEENQRARDAAIQNRDQIPTTSIEKDNEVVETHTTRPIIFHLKVQESPSKKPVYEEEKDEEEVEMIDDQTEIENENIDKDVLTEDSQDVESDLEVQSNEEVKAATNFKHFCSVCQKGFANLGALKKHFSVHTGDVVYECNVCKKRFTQPDSLQKHARMHKKKPLRRAIKSCSFPCRQCPRIFRTTQALKTHAVSHKRVRK